MEALARVLYWVILTAVHLGKERRYFGASVECSGETKQSGSDSERYGRNDLSNFDQE